MINRKKIINILPESLCTALFFAGSLITVLSGINADSFSKGFGSLGNGIYLYVNAFLEFLTRKNGRIHLLYAAENNRGYVLAAIVFCLIISIIYGLFLKKHKFIICAVCSLPLIIGFGVGFFTSKTGMILTLISLALGYTFTVHPKRSNISILIGTAAVMICAGVSIIICLILPFHSSGEMRENVTKALHRVIYENHDTLYEGEINKEISRKHDDETAFEVSVSEPCELFLRGFAGAEFDGRKWKALGSETLSKYSDLFYWLHDSGFYTSTQAVKVLDGIKDYPEIKVKIKNVSACRGYAFMPDICASESLNDPLLIDDSALRIKEKTYEVTVPSCAKSDLISAQSLVSNSANSDLLDCERAYAEFVKEEYLSVPEDVYSSLDRLMPDLKNIDNTVDKISYILDYFDNFTLNGDVSSYSGDKPLIWFLEQSKEGNEAMYATACAMMLRYAGIPSRYAEGYISHSDKMEFTILKSDAHIRAEYYLDGIGWISLETAPEYSDSEKELYQQKMYGQNLSGDMNKAKIQRPEEPVRQKRNGVKIPFSTVIVVLLIIAFAVLLALIILRRIKHIKKLQTVSQLPAKEKITELYSMAKDIQTKSGISIYDRDAQNLYSEALYSDHSFDDSQSDIINVYLQTVIKYSKMSSGIVEKVKFRLWYCLY